jgi:tetratricopeptide (TPR) repeat protein
VIVRFLQSLLSDPQAEFAGAEHLLEARARDQSNAWLSRGNHLMTTGQLGEAALAFRESLHAWADNAVALLNLAAISVDDDPEAALRQLRMAEKLTPDDPAVHTNLGTASMHLGRLEEARRHYIRALELAPGDLAARSNLATLDLAEGRHCAATWEAFRARWMHPSYPKRHALEGVRYLDDPVLPRERLLVHLEQGLGDEIYFAACLGDLRAHAAAVAVSCEPRLESLLTGAFPGMTVIPRTADWEARARAFAPQSQVYAGDLPCWLRRDGTGFPGARAYLHADPARAARWRKRLDALGGELKIGISWRGGGAATGRKERSIPLWEWAPLFCLPGVHWIDLQYGDHLDELQAVQAAGVRISRFDQAIADYDDTAALVSELDLVISVTTAVVDLAGAMNRPCWVLVPRRPLWKFGVRGEQMPWYPSLRLFRQDADEDWDCVLQKVADRLLCAGQAALDAPGPSPA